MTPIVTKKSTADLVYEDNSIQVANAPDFWARLVAAPHLFIGLDYDGTLAPFHIDPMQAKPLPGTAELIGLLDGRCSTAVAVISGRPIAELLILLGNLGVTLVGCHGMEVLSPTGAYVVRRPAANQEAGLRKAKKLAIRLGQGESLEVKMGSIALHTRGMPGTEASHIEALVIESWRELASRHRLRCRKFNGGVEIYSAGRHKGDALAELVNGRSGEALCIYIGDDDTDEDAFRWIRGRGVGIRVGGPSARTAATHFLPDCEGVRAFLKALLSLRTCRV